MPAHSSPKTLYRIDECPDLMADGVVGDENGNLVFISLWARDTAVQEFLARLTLGRDEQGLDQFHIITEQGASIPVFVGNVENLEKRSARALPAHAVRLADQHLAVRSALRQTRQGQRQRWRSCPRSDRLDRLWTLVRDTCPLPLLDPWRDSVLELLQAKSMLTRLPFASGLWKAIGSPSTCRR